jgi:hypothetical protein
MWIIQKKGSTARKTEVEVTCALIMDGEQVLVTQRGDWMPHPLKWEFPGGKLQSGETPERCVAQGDQGRAGDKHPCPGAIAFGQAYLLPGDHQTDPLCVPLAGWGDPTGRTSRTIAGWISVNWMIWTGWRPIWRSSALLKEKYLPTLGSGQQIPDAIGHIL